MKCTIFLGLLLIGFMGVRAQSSFDGTWIPVRQEMGGVAVPPSAFEKQKLIVLDSTYTYVAESVDKGIVHVSDDKLDIYGREGVNNGKHFTGVYKLSKEGLTICYNLAGDGYPESFETKGHPMYFLCMFRKLSAQ